MQTEDDGSNGDKGCSGANAEALVRAHAIEVASMREAFEARAAAMQDELLVRPLRSELLCLSMSLASPHSRALCWKSWLLLPADAGE